MAGPDPDAVRAHLEKVRASANFLAAPRRVALLDYLVAKAQRGEGEQINEYGIGLDVFGRKPDFDPRIDSIVRTEVSRLRQKLREYYAREGREEPLRIEIPHRTYTPVLTFRTPEAVPESAAPFPASRPRWSHAAGVAAVLLLVGLAFVLVQSGWTRHIAPVPPPGSLVVLPFQNLSPDQQSAYLADGVTEELTNDLAQWKDLRVVARTSAYQFKGKAVDIREVGRRLNVAAALEGSVARNGSHVRVTAQLNRTADGYHVWSHAYEVPFDDLLKVQTEAAEAVETALRQPGSTSPVAAPRVPTISAQAHDVYLQACYEFSRGTPDSLRRSRDLLQQAVAIDPRYVEAYIRMARAEMALVHFTAESSVEGEERLKAGIEKALEIDPNSADANGLKAWIAYNFDHDWPQAERIYRLALANGAQSTIRSSYGWALATRGRFREADEQLRLAQDLDPLGLGPRFNHMISLYLQRRYDDAERDVRGMLELNPDLLDAHLFVALLAVMRHNCAVATKEAEWCAAKYKLPVTRFGLAMASACRGDRAEALKHLQEMESAKVPFTSPYQLAMGYAMLNDPDRAIESLRRSAGEREGQILYMKYEPVFDNIRNDSRYVALEKMVGLE